MSQAEHSSAIGHPPEELRRAAVERAFECLSPLQQKPAIEELWSAVKRGERSLDGLFAACRSDEVTGALWTELVPGDSAALFPPRTASGAPPSLADELLAHGLAWLKAHGVEFVQCVLPTDTGDDAERLHWAGFEYSCDLLCLLSDARQFPATPVAAGLEFMRVGNDGLDDLAGVIEQTYQDTLDCPALDSHRDCRQVLAGYRATCRDELSHWFVVRREQRPIGCLLLGRDSSRTTWELVYMGLVHSARGLGLGLEVVRHAQWLVRQQNGERLLLAVDAANEPALRVYAAAGFTLWDRRSVYLKIFSPAKQ